MSEAKLILLPLTLAHKHFPLDCVAVLQHREGIPQHQVLIVLVKYTANKSSSSCSAVVKRLVEQACTATSFLGIIFQASAIIQSAYFYQDKLSNNHYIHDCRSIENSLNLHSA